MNRLVLPGLRWDNDRQRYFPVAALPPPTGTPTIVQQLGRPRPTLSSYHALARLRTVSCSVHKDALIHQIHASQLSLTDRTHRYPIHPQGLLSAFQCVSHNQRVYNFVGDTLGWIYSSVVEHDEPETIDWQPQYHLSSEARPSWNPNVLHLILQQVSSITLSPTACVATSFGPECKILYVPLDSTAQGTHISRIESRIVHDVWTSDLLGPRLVLGADKKAVVIEDIAASITLYSLPTKSDVFALAQRENVLYTGLRNGGVIRFDTRVPGSPGYPLFDSVSQRSSSITGLKHLYDHQLLVSFLDGGISAFDLRFPIRTPWMTFTGNVNSYTNKLPLTTDPRERFLFAAGQDNKIRIWSLATGGPALNESAELTHPTAFQHPFEHRVAALQVVEEREGMSLWAASGTELCKYSLGHRSGIQDSGGG